MGLHDRLISNYQNHQFLCLPRCGSRRWGCSWYLSIITKRKITWKSNQVSLRNSSIAPLSNSNGTASVFLLLVMPRDTPDFLLTDATQLSNICQVLEDQCDHTVQCDPSNPLLTHPLMLHLHSLQLHLPSLLSPLPLLQSPPDPAKYDALPFQQSSTQ